MQKNTNFCNAVTEYVLRLDGLLKMHLSINFGIKITHTILLPIVKCISKVILSEKLYEFFLAWNTVAFLKCTYFQSLSHCVFCKKNPYYIIYATHWFKISTKTMKDVCKEKSNKKRIFFGFEIYHQKHFLRWKEIIIINIV